MKLGKSASASPPSHQRLCGSVSGCGSAESNCEWGSARKTVRSTVRVSFSSSFIQANSWQGETSYQSRLLLEERGRKRAPNRNIISVVTISSATNADGWSDHRCGRVKTFDKNRVAVQRKGLSINRWKESDAGFRKTRAALHSSERIE